MNRIKIVLKAQGRSQKWLSEKLGVSTASLSLYANNHLSPKLDTLGAIAKILNVNIHDLIEPSKTPSKSLLEQN